MSIKLPSSLQNTLPKSLPLDWAQLELAHQDPPSISIRVNPKKATNKFEQAESIPWCTLGKYLDQRPSFTYDPLFHAGTYYVQEASSMFLEYALRQYIDFSSRLDVLDLCAAPGGKSTHIASLISEESLLISNEVIGTRVNILAENVLKWGYSNMWISNSDPIHFAKLPNQFDVLLLDAPCSGSGLFRKIPDYIDAWNYDLVALCAQRQKRILHDVYPSVSQNGIIVYMTCSLSKEENEDMLDYFMGEFALETCKINMDQTFGVIETESELSHAFGYRFFPHLTRGEGFFLALLRKKDGAEKNTIESKKSTPKSFLDVSKFMQEERMFNFLQNENLIAMQIAHKEIFDLLQKKIKIVKKGILMGKPLQKELLPSHELALYYCNTYQEHRIDLNLEQAISYLKKEALEISLPAKGWYLVCYEGFSIGWLKNIGNRINNYYPSNYRILGKKILH